MKLAVKMRKWPSAYAVGEALGSEALFLILYKEPSGWLTGACVSCIKVLLDLCSGSRSSTTGGETYFQPAKAFCQTNPTCPGCQHDNTPARIYDLLMNMSSKKSSLNILNVVSATPTLALSRGTSMPDLIRSRSRCDLEPLELKDT